MEKTIGELVKQSELSDFGKKQSYFEEKVQKNHDFQFNCHSNGNLSIEFMQLAFPIHTFICYLLLSKHSLSAIAINAVIYLQNNLALYHFFQAFFYIFNTSLFLSLLVAENRYKNMIWYSTIQKIIANYGLLTNIGLILTSFFLYVQLWSNIVSILMIIIASVFETVFCENYMERKKQNYKSEITLALRFKIGTILQVIFNILIYKYSNLTIFYVFGAMTGGLTLLWFTTGGYRLFAHQTPKIALLLFCGVQISAGILYLLLLNPRKISHEFSLFQFAISLIVVSYFLYTYQVKKRRVFKSPDYYLESNIKIKQYQLALEQLLEESETNQTKETLLIGIIYDSVRRCHQHHGKMKEEVYDPLTKNKFSHEHMVKEKQSILKFYLKCLYEKAIEKHTNTQVLMDFAEFGVIALGGINVHCLALEKVEHNKLGFLDRVRVVKLKNIMEKQSKYFNKLVFGGHLELDELMQAQETYSEILLAINNYCKESIDIWKTALNRQVDLNDVQKLLSSASTSLPLINQKWNTISKYVKVQPQWKLVYMSFNLFLKNMRIKNSQKIEIEEDLRSSQNEYLEERTPLNSTQQPSFGPLFVDKRSAILTCELYEHDLIMVKTNHSFQKITGFDFEQVKGNSIDLILPSKLQQYHGELVKKWFLEGFATDERTYKIRQSSVMTKDRKQIPTRVLYKIYLDPKQHQKTLKFMCLLNRMDRGQEDENRKAIVHSQRNSDKIFCENQENVLKLSNESNIFLKDQTLQSSPEASQICAIKISMRVLTLILVLLIVVFKFWFHDKVYHIQRHVKSLINFCNLYQYPMVLGKRYNDLFQTSFPPKIALINRHILQDAELARQYESDPLTRQIIFSPYNIPRYFPPFRENSINQGIEYSSTDVFYLIFSCIATLTNKEPKYSHHDFTQLNSYLKPGYDTMINSTKHEIHKEIINDVSQLKLYKIILMAIYSGISVIILVYICIKMKTYFSKMRQVKDIIIDFSQSEIKEILKHWEKVSHLFQQLSNHNRRETPLGRHQEKYEEKTEKEKEGISLNRSHKVVIPSRKQQKEQCKTITLAMLSAVISIVVLIALDILKLQKLTELSQFENAGFYIIRHYPTITVMSYGLSSKLYTETKPEMSQPFSIQQFQDTLSTIKIIVDYQPLQVKDEDKNSSLYLQKQFQYLFGNPCIFNPQLLEEKDIPYEWCTTVADRSLTTGIVSYLRTLLPTIDKYFRGQINLSPLEHLQLARGTTIAGYYLTDSINTWQDEIKEKLLFLSSLCNLLTLLILIVILSIHCLLFQLLLLPSLLKNYSFMKDIFDCYVPEQILLKEKIIRHLFHESGILPLK